MGKLGYTIAGLLGIIAGILPFITVGTGFDPDTGFFPNNDTILTTELEDVVSDEVAGPDSDGFNAGIDLVVGDCNGEGIQGIYCDPVEDNATAREKVTQIIRSVINYALGLIGLIALVYLLYHAFLTLTAGDDSEQADAGFKGMRYAAIAILGIGVARFLVSLIFFILGAVTDAI